MPANSDRSNPSGSLDRRAFIGAAGVGVAAAGLGATAARAGSAARSGRASRATRVIVMVSAGMRTGTLSLADMLHRDLRGVPSNWCRLWTEPGVRRSMVRTASADSLVTDSAAASTAWSIGQAVNNGAICFTPGNAQPAPILVRAKQAGLATGLVTTTHITHATPAAFVANVPARSLATPIAAQILDRGVDVALGGGSRYFSDELLARHADVTVVRSAAELAAAHGAAADGRLLGLFAQDHVPFLLDRDESHPALEAMTRTALQRLDRAAEGFVLQVEGGRVDHAAHGNDAGSLVAEQLEFDRALGVAMEYALGRDDTLLIVTTDHANANPGLTLYGEPGNAGFARLTNAKRSFEWIQRRMGEAADRAAAASMLPGLIVEATGGLELRRADVEWLERALVERQRVDGFLARGRDFNCTLGSLLANHYAVSFVSPNHTADMVELTAIGVGAERVEPVSHLADLHGVMTSALGLPAAT